MQDHLVYKTLMLSQQNEYSQDSFTARKQLHYVKEDQILK